jgi:acylphosphatase
MGKEATLNRIEKALTIVNDLKKIVRDYDFYPLPQRTEKIEKLGEIEKKLRNYLFKIKNDILEVAFVGVEKAGKSTFVNAFIGKNILPTGYTRTTYTSTQVKYDENGRVEITFFTEKEFLENFRKWLKEIGLDGWNTHTLDTLTLDILKLHFENLKEKDPSRYNSYVSTLKEDIEEVIKGKEEIKSLLNGGKLIFGENEIESYKDFITDPFKSRAVKEVVIYSSKLKGLENVIVYDLPGFDSPTLIHPRFTIEKIKRADAVVFIRQAKKPSLTQPEIKIITETFEEDGVSLKEKTFFFGNKIDEVQKDEEKDLEKIIEDFFRELEDKNVLENRNRVFFGSAKAHLQKLGVIEGTSSLDRLRELGFSTGIEELRSALVEYNRTERIKVLERRVENLLREVKSLLNEVEVKIRKELKEGDLSRIIPKESFSLRRKALETIEKEVNILHEKVKGILESKKISKNLKEKLQKEIIFPSQDVIEKKKREVSPQTSSTEEHPDTFNWKLRGLIKKKLNESFGLAVEESVGEEIVKFKNEVVEIFIKALSPAEKDKEELRKRVESFLEENLKHFSYESTGLRAIVERFWGDILELLMIPLTSQDRENKFKSAEREIISVSVYSSDFDPSLPPSKTSLTYQLLLQEDFSGKERILKKIKEVLPKFLNEEELKKIASFIISKRIPITLLRRASFKFAEDFQGVLRVLENLAEYSQLSVYELRRELIPPRNYDEVLEEINRDLSILKQVLEEIIINAVYPEKSFVISTTRYVNQLKELINSEKFDDFLIENLPLLKRETYAEVSKKNTLNALLQELLEKIENFKMAL